MKKVATFTVLAGYLWTGSVSAGETQRFLNTMLRNTPPTPVNSMHCQGATPIFSWKLPNGDRLDNYPGYEFVKLSGNPGSPILVYRGQSMVAACDNVPNDGNKWRIAVCPVGAEFIAEDDGEHAVVGDTITIPSWLSAGCIGAVVPKTASCNGGGQGQ